MTRSVAARLGAGVTSLYGVLSMAAIALVVLVALPLLFVVLQAVFPGLSEGSFTRPFSTFVPLFSDPALLGLLWNTLKLGVAVVFFSALLSVPLGALRALTKVPGGSLWDLLFLIPFMIPPYIAALSWMMTLQSGGYAQQLLGQNLDSFLFSFWGIVWVMVLNVYPVVYFAVSRTLMTVGDRFASAGRVAGAGPWRALFRLTLPMAIPGIAASLLLVFALTIEEFGTPATLGAQANYTVLVTGIHERFADWPIDIPGAATLSLLLVALAMGAFYLQHWVVTRRSYISMTGKPAVLEPRALGPWKWPVALLFGSTAFMAVGVPVLAVLATSFSGTISGGLSIDNLSLRHYQALLDDSAGALGALGTSLTFATGAALLTGILGALVGYLVVRARVRGRGFLDLLSLLPNTMPGIVVAVGLILVWNQGFWPVTVYNTSLMLLLAYTCLLLPYPVRYASAAFRQMGASLEDAARVCGANFVRTFWRVLLPALAPSLIVSMLLVFAIATRELVASLMVTPAGTSTVSTFVFGQFEQGSPGVGMAMSAVAIFTTTGLLVALTVFSRNRLPVRG